MPVLYSDEMKIITSVKHVGKQKRGNCRYKFTLLLQVLLLQLAMRRVCSQFTLTNSLSSVSDLKTLAPTVAYSLSFTFNNNVAATERVRIILSSRYNVNSSSLSDCLTTTVSGGVPSSTPCAVVYNSGAEQYRITFTGVFPSTATYTYLRIDFKITNPWAATTQSITTQIINLGDTTLGIGNTLITYIESVMNSCSFDSASTTTGDNSTHTAKFTPGVPIIENSYLLIKMPLWFDLLSLDSLGSSSLTCAGTQNTDSGVLSCGLSAGAEQTINVTGWAINNRTSGQIIMTISSLKNPWSLRQFGPISFSIMNRGGFVIQSCGNIMQSAMTNAHQFDFVHYPLTNNRISELNSNPSLSLFLTNPFPALNSQLRIAISGTATYIYTGTRTIVSQSATQLVLSGVSGVDLAPQQVLLVRNVSIRYPPSTKPFTITFTSELNISSTIYRIDQSSRTYQATAGTIANPSVTATNLFINRNAQYQIQFRTINALASGGFITVQFPPQLSISTGNGCTVSITAFCVVSTTSNITIMLSALLAANSLVTVTVNQVNNGAVQMQTTSFAIHTYYYSADFDSLVDRIDNGVTITLISGQINTFSVTAANLTTYTVTDYQFTVQLNTPIPQNGFIRLEFPSQIRPTPLGVSITAATFSISTCAINQPTVQRVQIQGCFASAAMSNMLVTFKLSGIRNPMSLETSPSIVFQTHSASEMLNFVSAGLTITPIDAINVNSITIIPISTTVAQPTVYTLTINHLIQTPQINDYLIVNLPSPMVFSSAFSTSCVASSGIALVACTYLDSTHLRVNYGSTPTGQQTVFTIDSVLNYQVADTPVTVQMQFYKSSGYLSEKGTASMTFSQANIQIFSVSNDQKIAFNQQSQVTISITIPFDLNPSVFTDSSLIKLIVTIPSGYSLPATILCSSTVGSCSSTSGTTFQIVNVGSTLSTTGISFTLTDLQLPDLSLSSNSFSIQYVYNSHNVSTIHTGVTVNAYCNAPCQRCRVPKNTCESCLPVSTPNTFIYHDPIGLSCLQQCVNGKYPDLSKVCQLCLPPCAYCSSTVDCITCQINTFLHNQRCINPCPDKFYEGTTNCQNCLNQCATCSDATSCDTCQQSYFLDPTIPTNNCKNTCPDTYYPNDSTDTCDPCVPPCAKCTSLSDCITCAGANVQYQSLCQPACPSQYYNVSGICETCENCVNCISASECSDCVDGYFLNQDQKICVSVCPQTAPIQNELFKICELCDIGCKLCHNIVNNCSSCLLSYYLYQTTCVSSCPQGYISNDETNSCNQQMQSLPTIYTPFIALQLIAAGVIAGSSIKYSFTATATNLAALVSVFQYTAWYIFVLMLYFDSSLEKPDTQVIKDTALYTSIAVIATMIILSSVYVVVAYIIAKQDKGFKDWINYHPCCLHTYRAVSFLSILLNFRLFRIIYGQLLNKTNCSAYFEKGDSLFSFTNKISYIAIVVCDVPMIAISAMTLAFKLDSQFSADSVFFACLENMVLGVACIIFVIVDSLKDKTYFDKMAGQLPFALTSVDVDL